MPAVKLFIAYSHRDSSLKESLVSHLAALRRSGITDDWHDGRIEPGDAWKEAIDLRLNDSQLILLLISADFIASDYCYGVEMKRALERHQAGSACVIPVILRPCDWSLSPFSVLQALPKNGKAVTTWPDRDEAWTDIAKGIRAKAEALSSAPCSSAPPMSETPSGSERTKSNTDACPDCSGQTADRCRSCRRCFSCIGEKRRWWRKAVFAEGYYCSSCAPSSDPGNIACS